MIRNILDIEYNKIKKNTELDNTVIVLSEESKKSEESEQSIQSNQSEKLDILENDEENIEKFDEIGEIVEIVEIPKNIIDIYALNKNYVFNIFNKKKYDEIKIFSKDMKTIMCEQGFFSYFIKNKKENIVEMENLRKYACEISKIIN